MGGDIHSIIDGKLVDAPYDLLTALNEGLTVFSWFENLPEDEQPPRAIWWSSELLDDWFEEVKKAREKGRSVGSSYDRADDAPMVSNELVDRS